LAFGVLREAQPIKIFRQDMPTLLVVSLLIGSSPFLSGEILLKKISFNQNISDNGALSTDPVHIEAGETFVMTLSD
jgi:hypothetical protein